VGVNVTPRPLYPPGKKPGTDCMGRRVGPRARLDRCGKFRHHREFFPMLLFLCVDGSAFCLLSLLTTHDTNIHFFVFLFSLCTLSVLVLTVLHFAVCPYCITHTNIYAPGGIRTLNPSKRSASHPHLRPLDHWDRRIRSPDHLACSEWLYRLSYRDRMVAAHFK
jgi:hypothetical protein